MHNFVLPATIAAFVFVVADASPAQAQVIVGNGYSQSYYGGSVLPIGNGVIVRAVEGQILGNTGMGYNSYSPYGSFSNYSKYGSQPYYGNGYRNYGYGNYGSYGNYGGNRGYRGYRGNGGYRR
ncbi:MAG: hypothetical protein C0467_32515 [Planctomycetaceae bacterium]|nr:hypothetical protein [Planctomycetaceae bacterium]